MVLIIGSLLFALGFTLGALMGSNKRGSISKEQKMELLGLRNFKRKITAEAAESASSGDVFAQVILMEISKMED